MSRAFQVTGDALILLGHDTDELGGSEYLCSLHRAAARAYFGALPRIMDNSQTAGV